MNEKVEELQNVLAHARKQVGKVIVGQQQAIDSSLIAIFSGGHVLIEGVPGVAKTLLVRTLAQLLGCEFQRVQFTSDVAPSDIIGSKVFNPQTNEFALVKGPVFTTFLMGDELNRAPARTQSAMLQAMQERQVTIDKDTFRLSPNFTVFATQNPTEYEGTFLLPEPQKDRFMLRITMGHPSEDEEVILGERTLTPEAPERVLEAGSIRAILSADRLALMRATLEEITVTQAMVRYVVNITQRTRNHSAIKLGAGPRSTQALLLASRVHAAFSGRDSVSSDNVKAMALACLEHRLILQPTFVEEGLTPAEAVRHILQSVKPPQ